jgi:hypothetical protein
MGFMGLRSWVKRLERDASEDLEDFELLDGSTYYYDPLEQFAMSLVCELS